MDSQQTRAQEKFDRLIRKLIQKVILIKLKQNSYKRFYNIQHDTNLYVILQLGLNEQTSQDGRFSAYLKVLQNELRFFKVEKSNLKEWIKMYGQELFSEF